ncbi:MAG: S8 family serine peptidase [Candidatus Jordarchaeales archaeon]|nr:S8 family serine peptidase [Candidatus Jordarchaeia archaeon]
MLVVGSHAFTRLSSLLGILFSFSAVLGMRFQVESLTPLVLSSLISPLSLLLLVLSVFFFSFPIVVDGRNNINYIIPAGTQVLLSYMVTLSGCTVLLRIQSFSLTVWDGYTRQIMLILPAFFYFVSWLRSLKGFSSIKEYLPLAVAASSLFFLSLHEQSPILIPGAESYLFVFPTGTTSSTMVASLLVFACGLIGITPPTRSLTGKIATALTFAPTISLSVSESLAAEKAASILGVYDNLIHSAFPLHFNFFICLSLTALLGGVALSSNRRTKQCALLSCTAFVLLYPTLYRLLSQPLKPVAVEPAPLTWLTVILAALILLHPTRLPKVLPALLLVPILLSSLPIYASASPSPLIPLNNTISVDDRIDPAILEMEGTPGPIHVILRFSSLTDDTLEKLNKTPYFEISYHESKPAVYRGYVNLVYGVLNASTDNWKDLVRKLVSNFNLIYVLLNRNPSETPSFNSDPAVYSVDADVLHSLNITGRGVTVAVIDSGINDADPEITGKNEGRIIYQVNFITRMEGDPALVGDLTPTDGKYHGTFVARTIAGVRGIAPHANLIDLKVQLEMGEMYYDTSLRIIEAIEWCIKNKDRFNISVINLSMGNREGTGGTIDKAVNKAVLAGITVVAAAGTWLNPTEIQINSIFTPGTASLAVTVGATQSYDNDVWAYLPASAIGPGWTAPKPDLVAPGPYTSGSAPIVAGVSALLHQAAAELNIPQSVKGLIVKQALIQGAIRHDLGTPGFDPLYGHGKVNALSSYLTLKNFS